MTRNISPKAKTLARVLANRDYDYLDQLREIREARGMSVAEVAAKLAFPKMPFTKLKLRTRIRH